MTIFAISIGILCGLRSLTPPALIAWAVYLGSLQVPSPFAALNSLLAVTLLSAFAIGELIGDKLPQTPNRTSLPPLVARIIMGGLAGACLATELALPVLLCTLLGACGGLIGTVVGFHLRVKASQKWPAQSFTIAGIEDLLTIAASLLILLAV